MRPGANNGEALVRLRIAVTRARAEAEEFCQHLEALGARPVLAPLIRVVPPADPRLLASAALRLAWYDWVVFTSVNGVEHFISALRAVGGSVPPPGELRVACIGPATAAAARVSGLRPVLVPRSAVAESLLDALLEQFFGEGGAGECGGMGVRVLLPVAAGARPVIDRGLRERGVVVDRVEAYRTVGDESGLEVLLPCLRSGEIDVLTFTSPSAVDYFVAGARDRAVGESLEDVVGGAVIASIGPVTSSAVRGYGLDVRVEAQEYTVRGLLEALAEYYR